MSCTNRTATGAQPSLPVIAALVLYFGSTSRRGGPHGITGPHFEGAIGGVGPGTHERPRTEHLLCTYITQGGMVMTLMQPLVPASGQVTWRYRQSEGRHKSADPRFEICRICVPLPDSPPGHLVGWDCKEQDRRAQSAWPGEESMSGSHFPQGRCSLALLCMPHRQHEDPHCHVMPC